MKVTFIDSGVLIAAARGTDAIAKRAMAILDDPDRTFASSPFVQLEVLPKANYNKKGSESAFYHAFFESVGAWAKPDGALVAKALIVSCDHGLGALDGLHVAAAEWVGAEELVTNEKPSKPIHRISSVRIVTIHPK